MSSARVHNNGEFSPQIVAGRRTFFVLHFRQTNRMLPCIQVLGIEVVCIYSFF